MKSINYWCSKICLYWNPKELSLLDLLIML